MDQPSQTSTPNPSPHHYAYLRISTDQQDTDNQKHGVLAYANSRGLANIEFIEDEASGKIHWHNRKLGALLLSQCVAGDTVIFSEISRMGRSTLQVLEILKHCVDAGILVHIAKQNMVLDESMQSKITTTILGLAAEIERDFISMRTKEALAKRKADGVQLGRPKGRAATVKLDLHTEAIKSYLAKGINKRDIARLVECSPSTLYDWLKRHGFR